MSIRELKLLRRDKKFLVDKGVPSSIKNFRLFLELQNEFLTLLVNTKTKLDGVNKE